MFAWYGAPSVPVIGDAPGIALVHGGGGTAFADWVRLWNARGYHAIAMDLNGAVPVGEYNNWSRHDWAGPAGISFPGTGAFEQIDEPVTDQWYFHGVGAVIRAHSLLASLPGVDPGRIGLTGISWGGYTACIVAGLDSRFKFAVPVYGCGFVDESPFWEQEFAKMGSENREKWTALWDPKQYLPNASMPFLWVTGTNDFAYSLPSLQQSYRAAPGSRNLCIRLRMPHGHDGPGENPLEIKVFADSILRGGAPLARFDQQTLNSSTLTAIVDGPFPIIRATLLSTCSRDDDWQLHEWHETPAQLDKATGAVTAKLPEGTSAAFLNAIDSRDCVVSCENITLA